MLSFALPWVFALMPLPLLVRWLAPPYRRPRTAVQVPFFHGLARASDREPGAGAVSRRRSLVQTGLFLLVWCALVAAAARPQWIEPPIVREQPTRDLLLLIDLSASMSARDFPAGDGETIERLEAVKQVLGDFLSRRKGDRLRIAEIRAERLKEKLGEGTGGKLPPDKVVFGKGPKNQPGGQPEAAPMSDSEIQATWLRRVQPRPADFLRLKFAQQAAGQKDE